MTLENNERVTLALAIAEQYGMVDGDHHKMWVIDQMIRALTGDEYPAWLEVVNSDPEYEPWDGGVPP